MSEIGKFLRELRSTDSLRVAAQKTGLSHGYIAYLEKGLSSTKYPIKPSPETLKMYSEAYQYPYEHLMKLADYISDEDENVVAISLDPQTYKLVELFNNLTKEKKVVVYKIVELFQDET